MAEEPTWEGSKKVGLMTVLLRAMLAVVPSGSPHQSPD